MRPTSWIRPALLAAGALAGWAPPAGPAAVPAARGTIVHETFNAPSIHDPKRSVRVYLPPSYDRPESAGRRYSAVYLLHGWPGGDGNWPGSGDAGTTLDTLIARGAIPEVIAVMPNGNGVGLLGRSLYLNTFDGVSRMEDYIARDLVTWVDSTYRTRREASQRALIGLSEGASAAVNITFRHPDTFGGCG
jgi:enterochelin esterase-like enzyme